MYFRTYTNSYKALLVCIISFFLTFTPSLVFATTVSAEGWSVTKRIVNGATTIYDGAKNVVINGKNYTAKGVASVTPAASQVSKMIVRTGAILAVDLAIKSLIGAVDYVMDPANNRVRYFVTGDPANPQDPSVKYYYSVNSFGVIKNFSSNLAAATDICTRNAKGYGWILVSTTPATFAPDEEALKSAICVIKRSASEPNEAFQWPYNRIKNPAYNPNATDPTREEKYLPYDAVASQIISDAVANKTEGKAYVSSVADTALEDEQRQIVPATDITQQLNNSQSIPTSGAATGAIAPPTTVDPTTGEPVTPKPSDLTLNFPEFCGWAPLVCQAAQSAINFPSTVAEYWKSLTEYLKGFDTWLNSFGKDDVNYPELDEYKIQEPNLDISVHQYFDSSAFCPEDRHIPLSMGGQSLDIIISYSALCTVAQQFRPAVILMSFLAGAFIITNTGRRAETGD
ncbi:MULTISPECIES: virulence factor TspB C-terminal domain-related protein [unclassified Acinetobacter]|uniref:virulence factor TspB C-terminal domain-related protein n=1 Tax=unclassified Acinetobacter TaxID=196816 RepID=UPI00287D5BC4|nr:MULTISPECIES: virulence factor TspB C-terminal domain-related protein [unclassified Acinetobacter]MDS7958266.1 virulence factor TspB C-terminal domain-related protein [Acinetobacter sp. V104_13]MDS7981487.1 virulence factor TspB C-terminal domain-related protein [Acinetobacter sp. V104_3]